MSDKLKMWDERAEAAAAKKPLKSLKNLPKMPGIAEEGIRRKAFRWMIAKDDGSLRRHVLRRPLFHLTRFLRSFVHKKSYAHREDDFYCYGLKSVGEFEKLAANPSKTILVGFSYCHKPFECPSGRFTDACAADERSLVCQQCFIGKMRSALPKKRVETIIIPTVHYVGRKVFEAVEKYGHKNMLFLITACELTLEMFGDYGNMAGVRGLGVRLGGRICNTMEAFAKSEEGIKPGLTVVLPQTQARMLELIDHFLPSK